MVTMVPGMRPESSTQNCHHRRGPCRLNWLNLGETDLDKCYERADGLLGVWAGVGQSWDRQSVGGIGVGKLVACIERLEEEVTWTCSIGLGWFINRWSLGLSGHYNLVASLQLAWAQLTKYDNWTGRMGFDQS